MSIAWETTDTDVLIAVKSASGADIGYETAETVLDSLDQGEIEKAALAGDDMEEQTSYAHANIVEQLRELIAAGDLPELAHLKFDVGGTDSETMPGM